jgi:hypothetical protein
MSSFEFCRLPLGWYQHCSATVQLDSDWPRILGDATGSSCKMHVIFTLSNTGLPELHGHNLHVCTEEFARAILPVMSVIHSIICSSKTYMRLRYATSADLSRSIAPRHCVCRQSYALQNARAELQRSRRPMFMQTRRIQATLR